jgi:hypothetical protein
MLAHIKKLAVQLMVLTIVVGTFSYTVIQRAPYIGSINGPHTWLSGSTAKFARNWYREDPYKLRFSMLEQPLSIETPNIADREPYLSYLPGSVFPVFAASKFLMSEPDISTVHLVNLSNHLIIAVVIAFGLGFLAVKTTKKVIQSFFLSTIAAIGYLVWPSNMYWHQNSYFADQAVILPFISVVLLEAIRIETAHVKLRKVLGLAISILLFIGTFTDWLFIPLVPILLFCRIFVSNEIRPIDKQRSYNSIASVLIPVIIALILYLLQIQTFGRFGYVVNTMLFRTGASESGSAFFNDFGGFFSGYFHNIHDQLGIGGILIYLLSLLASILLAAYLVIVKFNSRSLRIPKGILSVMIILPLTCLLHAIILRNHTFIHNFSVLKISLVFFVYPVLILVLAEYLLAGRLYEVNSKALLHIGRSAVLAAVSLFSLLLLFTHNLHFKRWFEIDAAQAAANAKDLEFAEFVGDISEYGDIVVSPELEIPSNPPQLLATSMKRVHKTHDAKSAISFAQRHRSDLVITWREPSKINQDWILLISKARKNGSRLYFSRTGSFAALRISFPIAS